MQNRGRQASQEAVKATLAAVDTSCVIGKFYLDRMHFRHARGVGRHATEEIISSGHRTSHELDDIDHRIDRLALICEAMWSLLHDHTDLTTEDLEKRLVELDDVDGHRNFRRQRVAQPCECGAKIPPVRLSCQFCGAPASNRSLFDAI